jgi:very-short-patch-repair endonuclease
MVFLDVERYLDALDKAWPAEVEVPFEDTPHERFQWHATELRLLQTLLDVGRDLNEHSQRLTWLGVPQPDWNDLAAIAAFARLIDAAAARDSLAVAQAPLDVLRTSAAQAARRPGASAVCGHLAEALERSAPVDYDHAYRRLHHLYTLRDKVAQRNDLSSRLSASAPALASAIISDPQQADWTARLAALAAAWRWSRVGTWILSLESVDANDLEVQLDRAEDAIRHEVEQLAALRAWRHALHPERLTGQARADLNHYVRLVKGLGRGTGKYAAVRRTEIRQAMDNCRPAVPVWIMPIYRIAEQLRVTENMFDVVIVDEASQAGLEATFLQFLAPKIVVIGDDKQVSPSAVGVDQQQLRDLASQYLYDHRYKDSWQDPKLSLFDAAAIWYGSKRTLVEHRRCVPEIIGFSNRIAYEPENIRLIPVRQFGADRLQPIKPVHVTAGYEAGSTGSKVNRPEAQAIADQIVQCLSDPAYAGKTFGVISLLGPTQAKAINNLLLDRVASEDWAARDLRCGDAAAFQGSERDVMFLSMVSSAPEPGQRIGTRIDLASIQRYNVAASRARDQMWVFHSVALNQLVNPDDLRHKLLDYCYNVVPNLRLNDEGTLIGLAPDGELVRPFDSLFEQRVNNRLVARGYTVIPQFDSMGYRIDLVVVGAKTRLAVECDGDFWHGPEQYLADLARERDLRRCGWEFFRIRESAFYVDEHAALSSLWTVLDGLGIKPIGSSPSPAAQPPASDHPAVDTVAECAAMPPANDAPHEVSGPVPVTSFSVEADAPAPEASSARASTR